MNMYVQEKVLYHPSSHSRALALGELLLCYALACPLAGIMQGLQALKT